MNFAQLFVRASRHADLPAVALGTDVLLRDGELVREILASPPAVEILRVDEVQARSPESPRPLTRHPAASGWFR